MSHQRDNCEKLYIIRYLLAVRPIKLKKINFF